MLQRRLLLSLGSIALATTSTPAFSQAPNWLRSPVNGHWYAETPGPMSWSISESFAQLAGGHLVTIGSQAESSWLDLSFFSAAGTNRYHWIGYYQDAQDPGYFEPGGGWKWVSGENATYSAWAPGAPNDPSNAESFARTNGSAFCCAPAEWDDDEGDGASPDSAFDWYIPPGQIVVFDTVSSQIQTWQLAFAVGSDDLTQATPGGALSISGGLVDIDDLYIDTGAVLKIEGPNPLVVLASGRVVIRGRLDASGASSSGVVTLNTTGIPEPGAPGHAGGGRGGTGSPSSTGSSPKGGDGFGAFDAPNLGGGGGETGWSSSPGTDSRRGAGGGGGVLGPNVLFPGSTTQFDQRRIGFDAEPGFDNLHASNGAIHGPGPARGGSVGASPFADSNPGNDFVGAMVLAASNSLVIGELQRPWAGAGGGAGGDASYVPGGGWPGPWTPTGDEKGAGGAGGGGSVNVMAIEHIAFGASGEIRSRGGFGGGGENTIFLNRVGGGSGGGSGGHVILHSASRIDLRAKTGASLAIDTRGGQGGAGANDVGGATQSPNGQVETSPLNDACPPGYPASGVNACKGHVDGAGGDGGPGIVQLHTLAGMVGNASTPGADILLAPGVTLDQVCAPRPICSDNTPANPTCRMLPNGGRGIGLIELASADCDGNSLPDAYEVALHANLDANGNGTLDACEPALAYCVSGTTTAGCSPVVAWTGTPSATALAGFDIAVTQVEGQRAGTIFYGLASTALAWSPVSSSVLCVAPPTQRTGLMQSPGTPGQCNGQLDLDWNAWRNAHPGALGEPFAAGQTLYAQGWLRDPGAPRGSSLSNGLSFTLAP